jgi:2',3'-cyclic-nucleotide 2'-phosphodiesterase (5'-nucleotidase family)
VHYADGSLGRFLEDAALKAVAANILTDTGGDALSVFAPSAVITVQSGRRLGFFGLTDPGTVNKTLESNLTGLRFADPVITARQQAAALAASNSDLIIGLSNAGVSDADGTVIIDIDSAELTIGRVIIDNATGGIESRVKLNPSELTAADAGVQAAVDAFKAVVAAEYPPAAIVRSEVTLNGTMTANRSAETNLGNLWADALLWFALEGGIGNYYDEDELELGNTGIMADDSHVVAIWNGGNLRDFINTGDVTMKDIRRVLPFPNRAAVAYLSGAQLLELLEASTQGLPYTPASLDTGAAFLHVAGLEYTIDLSKPYDAGEAYGAHWFRAGSVNRVTINHINGLPFDPAATYAVVTSNAIYNGMDSNYIMRERDPEFSVITSAFVTDIIWLYINRSLGGVIGEQYAAPQGRVNIKPENMTRAVFINMLYSLAGSPDVELSGRFADVAPGAYYARAVEWAVREGITNGRSESLFAPHAQITSKATTYP